MMSAKVFYDGPNAYVIDENPEGHFGHKVLCPDGKVRDYGMASMAGWTKPLLKRAKAHDKPCGHAKIKSGAGLEWCNDCGATRSTGSKGEWNRP